MNLTDISVTPIHVAFEEVCKMSKMKGLQVTGSELIGLVPLKAMLDAGEYFSKKQKKSTELTDDELIRIAVKSLGLDALQPFEPKKKILEYLISD
jgi:glutamate formiminotransferase/formiminotetrahydrofolate cyclodeaminase